MIRCCYSNNFLCRLKLNFLVTLTPWVQSIHQNFWKFQSKPEWIGSVQTEKFPKKTVKGGQLYSVGLVRSKLTVPFDVSGKILNPSTSLFITFSVVSSNNIYSTALKYLPFYRGFAPDNSQINTAFSLGQWCGMPKFNWGFTKGFCGTEYCGKR